LLQGSEKPGFLKKPNSLGFIGFFGLFYLNEQLGSLLVDLGHQLNFFFIRQYFIYIFTLSLLIGG